MTTSATPDADDAIILRDGRELAFATWGPRDGRPFIALYGTPGSRLFNPDVEATRSAGARLIAVDRPGYGRSSIQRGMTIRSFTEDLAELHRRLGIERSQVLGWSGGGPYAMGFAARYPDLVERLEVAASWGPLTEVPGALDEYSDATRELLALGAVDREAARPAVEARCAWFAEEPERIADRLSTGEGPDARMLDDPNFNSAFRAWFREGARQGAAGYVEDWLASYAAPWNFDFGDVVAPTRIWWGDADSLCSRAHTDYLATVLPDAELVILPGEGHNAPGAHWAEILSALA